MALKINEASMMAEVDGAVITTAIRTGDRWTASTWLETLRRNQAITALMSVKRLAARHRDDDPLVRRRGTSRSPAGTAFRCAPR